MSVQKKSLLTQRSSVKKAIMAKPQTSASIKPAMHTAVKSSLKAGIRPAVATAVRTKVSASEA